MARASLIGDLAAEGPVLTDGAWGTQLQSMGLGGGELADFWNLSHPDRVEAVARSYVGAGSEVILTNTFQANRVAAAKHPDRDRIAHVNRAGVEISRRATGDDTYVFATMGPSGKLLMTGDVTEDELRGAYDEQAAALAEAHPDAIVIETMSDLAEAEIAVGSARSTGLPVVACMIYDSGKSKNRTMMGTTPTEAAERLAKAGADAIGANCGTGIEAYVPVCRELVEATDLPVWIKANAGLPELVDGEVVYRTTPADFADRAEILLEAGATFVGGCCGTTPDFIRLLADRFGR